MPIPANTARIVFRGALDGGEIWESGFWVHGSVPTSNDNAEGLAGAALGLATSTDNSGALHTCAEDLWDAFTNVSEATCYSYPNGGIAAEYIGTNTQTPLVGSGAGRCPNQIALVISLRSAAAGRRNRGRMYMPATGPTLSASGQVSPSVTAAVCSSWANFFGDWNALSGNPQVSVVSRIGAGAVAPVTRVAVDSVLDTQRRRRNKVTAVTLSDDPLFTS